VSDASITSVHEPNPQHAEQYARLYTLFRTLYEHVRKDFDRLAEIP
jgi:hypothetical protein